MRLAVMFAAVAALHVSAFPVPKEGRAPSAEGTVYKGTNRWSGGEGETLTLTFKGDGVLIYHSGSMPLSSYSATWKQEGKVLTWIVNNHATFTATIDGDKLEGHGSNKLGNQAVVKFKKESASDAAP